METEITLYTLDTCPMCKYIKGLLEQKEIQFNIVDNIEQMQNENICSVPQLKVGNVLLNLSEAQEWIKKR